MMERSRKPEMDKTGDGSKTREVCVGSRHGMMLKVDTDNTYIGDE